VKIDLISANDLSRADIDLYLEGATWVAGASPSEKLALLRGRILMAMFFEPSTRTRLSFESAMCRLGGNAIGFSDVAATSVSKGESFLDTVHTVENYADILVIRHSREGAARIAAEASRLPVINAGDGTNQHPSQTLLDLYTIRRFFGRLEGIRIALVGDLKYSRTVHSLFRALRLFDGVSFRLVSPPSLKMPDYLLPAGQDSVQQGSDLVEAVSDCDVIYMTRIQKERFPDVVEYERLKDSYRLDAKMLTGAKPHLKVMHPLPRVNEIANDVDPTPCSGYFEQVANGVIMRQAILLHLLGARP
jgi:aspartate carbamoyltransferase catalytic subunit